MQRIEHLQIIQMSFMLLPFDFFPPQMVRGSPLVVEHLPAQCFQKQTSFLFRWLKMKAKSHCAIRSTKSKPVIQTVQPQSCQQLCYLSSLVVITSSDPL